MYTICSMGMREYCNTHLVLNAFKQILFKSKTLNQKLARPISLFFIIHVVKVCMSLQMLSTILDFLVLLPLNAGKMARILLIRLDLNAYRCSFFLLARVFIMCDASS